MNMMILGIHNKAPTMQEIYVHNALGWLGTDTHVLKFEELLAAVKDLQSDSAFPRPSCEMFYNSASNRLDCPLAVHHLFANPNQINGRTAHPIQI